MERIELLDTEILTYLKSWQTFGDEPQQISIEEYTFEKQSIWCIVDIIALKFNSQGKNLHFEGHAHYSVFH